MEKNDQAGTFPTNEILVQVLSVCGPAHLLLLEMGSNQRFDNFLVAGPDLQILEGVFRSRDIRDAVNVGREELASSKRVSDQALWQEGQFIVICSVCP